MSYPRTILITGGAGFIGSCLVRRLVGQGGARVVNLDKLTYAGNLDSLVGAMDNPGHTFIQGDICDRSLLSGIFEQHQPDAVIHLAAESHVDRSIDAPAAFVQTNIVGAFELLEAARRHWTGLAPAKRDAFRFLHVSTDEVYGSLGAQGAFTEVTPYDPSSPYAASKAAADHFARAYYRTYGLPVMVTNCSNNYGPYQFPEKLIPLITLNALEGKPLPVYGDGQQVRDWLYVEDHCHALECVLERGKPGEVYNIGGRAEQTNLDVVRKICDTVDRLRPRASGSRRDLITTVADRPGHDRRYAMDISKIERELGWRPHQSFDSGLTATVEWYLSNPEWVARASATGYARERLGLPSRGAL